MSSAIPSLTRVPATEKGLTIADFLIPVRLGERTSPRLRDVALVIAGAVLIFLTAKVSVPIPGNPVPFTLQNFGVLVVGGALGFRRGGAASFLYVALGVIGLPFFAEGKGGMSVIWGTTGGYLIGFIVAGALVGRLAELGWDRRIGGALGATALGTLAIYAIGVPWLAAVTGQSLALGDRQGPAPVPRVRHRQARRRGRGVPGGVVGGRPTAQRPLMADPGLYGPGSEAWRLNREATVLLGAGPRALLLQLAHPLVAEGVDQHSDFRADPWSRLAGTLRSYLRIVYGTTAQAQGRDPAPERPPSVHRGAGARPGGGVAVRRGVRGARPGALAVGPRHARRLDAGHGACLARAAQRRAARAVLRGDDGGRAAVRGVRRGRSRRTSTRSTPTWPGCCRPMDRCTRRRSRGSSPTSSCTRRWGRPWPGARWRGGWARRRRRSARPSTRCRGPRSRGCSCRRSGSCPRAFATSTGSRGAPRERAIDAWLVTAWRAWRPLVPPSLRWFPRALAADARMRA